MDETTGWLALVREVFSGIGIVAFAISGALLAVHKRMDLVGMAGLAVVTATGGGMLRDMLIGATPVAALVNWWMLAAALGGAFIVFVLHRWISRLDKPVLLFDAIGLGVFAVEGAQKAIDYGVGPVGAAFVGMLTGIGGGIVRDTLANDIPAVFRRDSRLYLLPALVGSSATAAALTLGFGNGIVLAVIAASVVGLRIASELLRWHVPSLRTEAITIVGDGRG